MGLLQRFKQNFDDARVFGPKFLLRHVARGHGAATTQVHVPGIGPIHVRVGESDVAAVREIFADRDYDLGENSPVGSRIKARYLDIIRQGRVPVIVDAGANIGAASLWFRSVYPDAAIVAVEPEPQNGRILHLNLDQRPGFFVADAAIGAEAGFVTIENDQSGWGARTAKASGGIPVITVADAVARVPDGASFMVKVDIEGFEAELFSKNVDWIDDAYAVIIEPHDWMLPGKLSSRSFQRAMAKHDFEMFLSGENLIYVRP